MGYKCTNCDKEKPDGSPVYFINSYEGLMVLPTCSAKCAKAKNAMAIKILQNRIEIISTAKIVREIWDK